MYKKKQHPDIKPRQKNNPFSGSAVCFCIFDSLYDEVKLPAADSDMQDNINQFLSYRAYKELINYLAFGSTAFALFPPRINEKADLSEAMDDHYQYLKCR